MTATVQRAVTAVTFKPKRSIAEINTALDRFAERELIFAIDRDDWVNNAKIHPSFQQRRLTNITPISA